MRKGKKKKHDNKIYLFICIAFVWWNENLPSNFNTLKTPTTYIHIYIYTPYTHIHTHVYIYIYIYIYIYHIYTYINIHVYIYTHHIYTYINTHVYLYIHHIYTYIHNHYTQTHTACIYILYICTLKKSKYFWKKHYIKPDQMVL